uniref:Uncharacterized protein n=1 Tax=Homalodisca liturata TaxID=320908 RepID=A0A1B6JPI3_9HEMI
MQQNILLNLSDRCFTDKDIPSVIATLSTDQRINQLDLSNNFITDYGIKYLLRSCHINNIFYFNLFNNSIGDEGALAVVQSSRNNNIASLNLARNCISAHGIKSIASCLPGSKIVNLDLIFNPGSEDPSAFKAILEATIRHPILQYLHVPTEFNKAIRPVLLENRQFVSRTKKKLIKLITDLDRYDSFYYPMIGLGSLSLIRFQEFYYNQMLNSSLVSLNRIVTCNKIKNYINDHYFKLTGVVQYSVEVDDISVMSIANLPPEVLSRITKFCLLTDVKGSSIPCLQN